MSDKYKYIINPRGRRLQPLLKKEADILLSRGFTEVDRATWESKEYFPEFEKQTIQPVGETTSRPSVKDRSIIKTKVV